MGCDLVPLCYGYQVPESGGVKKFQQDMHTKKYKNKNPYVPQLSPGKICKSVLLRSKYRPSKSHFYG